MKHQILDEETIKLAEKLLIASHGSSWAGKMSYESLANCAINQAKAFFAAAAKETKSTQPTKQP